MLSLPVKYGSENCQNRTKRPSLVWQQQLNHPAHDDADTAHVQQEHSVAACAHSPQVELVIYNNKWKLFVR